MGTLTSNGLMERITKELIFKAGDTTTLVDTQYLVKSIPAGNCMFKINNRNTIAIGFVLVSLL